MGTITNFLKYWQLYQSRVAVFLCLCMIAGMFWSRAVLSVSIVVFFVNSLHPQTFKSNLTYWSKDKFSIFCLLFFAAYFVSGLWSTNKGDFWFAITNKLPFLIFPFSFSSIYLNKKKELQALVGGLLAMQVIVIFYSIIMLCLNWDHYIQGYNFSHTLETTKYNDYIRFSLSLVLSMSLICYLLFEKNKDEIPKIFRYFLIFCGVLFFGYLHFLAVKTGVISLYLMSILYVLGKLFKRRKVLALLIVMIICLLPVVAYHFIPTFKTKIGYVLYEFREFNEHDKMNYNLSDQGRILSYKIAGKVFKDNLLLGTGLGDLKKEMNETYQTQHPEVPPDNRLIPHNQFLFTFVVLGFFLGFILILMLPFGLVWHTNISLYSKITLLIFLFAFMAEAMLEIQFGVFIYMFFTLFWRNLNKHHSLSTKTSQHLE